MPPPTQPPRVGDSFTCCRVRVDPLPLGIAVGRILEDAFFGGGRAVHLCNAYTLSLAQRDDAYADLLNRGDTNLPDGMPLVWLGKRLGFHIDAHSRPRGPDVLVTAVIEGRRFGLRHYLYGATEPVVTALAAALEALAPGVEIVGVESPPFRLLTLKEKEALVERVHAAAPHILWVGLGTPRQDLFVDEFRARLGCVLVAVGAAFDFVSGNKPEAPPWMRVHGLEWVHRLASEPRRLWRRYLVGNTVFLAGMASGGIHLVNRPAPIEHWHKAVERTTATGAAARGAEPVKL